MFIKTENGCTNFIDNIMLLQRSNICTWTAFDLVQQPICIPQTYLSERIYMCLCQCMQYLFLLQPHSSSPSAGSEDSLGGKATHTAAALLAKPRRQTGNSIWTPAVKTSNKKLHQSFRHGRATELDKTDVFYSCVSGCTSFFQIFQLWLLFECKLILS